MRKRIAVCYPQVPFEYGGIELQVDTLVEKLEQSGYSACSVSLPYKWYPNDVLLDNVAAWRMVDLTQAEGQPIDAVICVKFPAYVVQHPRKIVWLAHQYRQVYDLFGRPGGLPDTEENRLLQGALKRIDYTSLSEAVHIFTISQNVRNRLLHYNEIDSEVLYLPIANEEQYHAVDYGDYVLSVGRLDPLKRTDLLVEAFRYVRSGARCLIAGDGVQREHLESMIRRYGLDQKVSLLGRLPFPKLLGLYAGALAVYYAPIDEDYGLVTVEAFKSGRPVITAHDSGGVLEFTRDGETGCVVSPEPEQIAAAVDLLFENRSLAERYGQAGRELVTNINWDYALERLKAYL
ncbi:MAG: glycosyltransferase family 4 protein [Bacillota bacterium]